MSKKRPRIGNNAKSPGELGAGGGPNPQELSTLVALASAGRYPEAVTLAREMTKRHPKHGPARAALGWLLRTMGQQADSLASLLKAAALAPDDCGVHNLLGSTLLDLGRLKEAEASYRRALEIKPDFAEAHNNLGNVLNESDRPTDAEASYRRALEIAPNNAEARNNLGNVLLKSDRFDEAEAAYRRALELNPNYFEAGHNLAGLLLKLNRLDEAAATYRRVLQIQPEHPDAHNILGNVLLRLGRSAEAEGSYRRALQLAPDFAEAHNNLGNALGELGRPDEAAACYRRALRIKPDYAEALNNLGNALLNLDRLAEAESCYRQALKIKPDFAEAHGNLGNFLQATAQLEQAEACYRRALEINPDFAKAHNNLGNALKDMGRLDEAVACHHWALQIKPDYVEAQSNLLGTLTFTSHGESQYRDAARQFDAMVTRKARAPFSSWQVANPPARLRVGLVSGDLRHHSVSYFLEGLLTNIDPDCMELYAYPTHHEADDLTARIKPCFAAWKPLVGQGDETAARMIRSDGVHVLIDLAGHTAHNRLPVFAWKPAPVQATWLGYLASTGMTAIDYLIADPWTLPTREEANFTERIWRLPETYICFTPPHMGIAVSPLPALATGSVTFGSFNNLTKVGDAVLALWARVLVSVPDSRLFLKTKQLEDRSVREDIVTRFGYHGIDAGRLILQGSVQSRAEHLASYQRLDIALDPFPYPGITTSAESLWMGVPVLTLAGESFLARQGLGLLSNAGLPEWIAVDADDYLKRAVSHAADLESLAALREGLRSRVLASPIFDAPRFARHFENALWGMWEGYRRGHDGEVNSLVSCSYSAER